ncbi:MAG: PepSY domain-containing protein [Rhodocyclales bacterium]|nr:PepSY domain-containing protein [Rhodocyclales bacterium]
MKRSSWAATLLAVLLLTAWAVPGRADGDDHERARRALEAGEVLPLRTVLDRIEPDHPGQVMEVELEREDGVWVYEIKLLRAGGALVKLEVDARDGSVRRVKERGKGGH